jgi:hypothetical protein
MRQRTAERREGTAFSFNRVPIGPRFSVAETRGVALAVKQTKPDLVRSCGPSAGSGIALDF